MVHAIWGQGPRNGTVAAVHVAVTAAIGRNHVAVETVAVHSLLSVESSMALRAEKTRRNELVYYTYTNARNLQVFRSSLKNVSSNYLSIPLSNLDPSVKKGKKKEKS